MGSRVLLALSCAVPLLLAGSLSGQAAPVGSYTINMPAPSAGGTPAGTKIRITAKAGAKTFDQEFSFGGGETSEQVRNTIKTALVGDGWTVADNGTNGITITGNGADKISKVDGGTNIVKFLALSLDGSNVTINTATPGDKNFKVSFEPGLGGDTQNALVSLDLEGFSEFNQLVPSSPSLAADSFFDVFVSLSFPDVQHVGNEILFSQLPGGAQVTGIESFVTDSPALHLGITIPDPEAVPAPGTLGLVLAGSLTAIVWARRRRSN